MARETGPQDYQFRHAQRMSMNSYDGIASGRMQLDDPTADGFMRVADMRRNIVITRRGQSRTYDYDQVGPTRVAKILEIPRIGRGENGALRTHREDDTWLIEIEDQKLWKEISEGEGTFEQKEDRFVDRFREEIVTGTTKFLLEEKLFNGGIFSPAVVMGGLSVIHYALPVLAEAVTIASGRHTIAVDISSVISVACNHLLFNGIAWMLTQRQPLGGGFEQMLPNWYHLVPDSREPFIRNNPLEILMPVVPVDRLIRGGVYLKSHGDELIQTI